MDHLNSHMITIHNTTEVNLPPTPRKTPLQNNSYPNLYDKKGNPLKLFQIEKAEKNKIIREPSPVNKRKDEKENIERRPIDSELIQKRLESDIEIRD